MTRLDAALVARGLARSRGHARDLIGAGAVIVRGTIATKPAMQVTDDEDVLVELEASRTGRTPVLDATWVSRAAGKLLGALDDLPGGGPQVAGRTAADVGACTGGFTQVLLRRGAEHVYAIDVGHDQLAVTLGSDVRVSDLSGVNARELTPGHVGGGVDLVVADLSFISLTLVLGPLAGITRPGGDLLVLIKPQFEVGRAGLDGRGVVRSADRRRSALRTVLEAARTAGLELRSLVRSRTPGQDGNTEYLAWLRRPPLQGGPGAAGAGASWESVTEEIERVIAADDASRKSTTEPTGGR